MDELYFEMMHQNLLKFGKKVPGSDDFKFSLKFLFKIMKNKLWNATSKLIEGVIKDVPAPWSGMMEGQLGFQQSDICNQA